MNQERLLSDAVSLLTEGKAPVVRICEGSAAAVLRKLAHSAVGLAANSLGEGGSPLAQPEELLSWKVGCAQKLLRIGGFRTALLSAATESPFMERSASEQGDSGQLRECLAIALGGQGETIVGSTERERQELCFLLIDLIRAMFTAQDAEEDGYKWRSHNESVSWVQKYRSEWLCADESVPTPFESREPFWLNDSRRASFADSVKTPMDLLDFAADEKLGRLLLVPLFIVRDRGRFGALLPAAPKVYRLNGSVSIPAFVRVLLDLHFLEKLRGGAAPESFSAEERLVLESLYRDQGLPELEKTAAVRLKDLLWQASPFNLLVASLSTIGKNLRPSTYEGAEYYYPLEPIAIKIQKELADRAQSLDMALLLASRKTLEKAPLLLNDAPYSDGISAYEFCTERLRTVQADMQSRMFELEPDKEGSAPADAINAVRHVVSVLRALHDMSFERIGVRVHLATNGGLRGYQLILEAILSLLKNEDIEVEPADVWAVEYSAEKKEAGVFPSYQEFNIFDYVSGINEFIRYGRVDLLDQYYHRQGAKSPELMSKITRIADSIRCNNVTGLNTDIKNLRDYYKSVREGEKTLSDPYVMIFFDAIRDDYGALLKGAGDLNPIDEIDWCVRKGLYMQAYTIAETHMPKRFFDLGWVKLKGLDLNRDYSVIKAVKRQARQMTTDLQLALFNSMFISWVKGPTQKSKRLWECCKCKDFLKNGHNVTYVDGATSYQFYVTVPKEFSDLIKWHFTTKDLRNTMCHPDGSTARTTKEYKDVISNYLDSIGKLMSTQRKKTDPSILIEYKGFKF